MKNKKCLICSGPNPNSMLKTCSPLCQRKHERNLKKIKEEKDKERKVRASERVNISIDGLEDEDKDKVRDDLRKIISPFLKSRKVTIKIGRGKTRSDYRKLRDKLDTVHSKYIRLRDGKCVTCGSKENLQNGHLFSRVNLSTRWDDIGCNTQCGACNILHEHNSKPYTDWFIREYGQSMYEDLHERWHGKPVKLTQEWLEQKIAHYENEIKKLTND